jgi:ribosomal protein S18 acetylase RimI-like enzyme
MRYDDKKTHQLAEPYALYWRQFLQRTYEDRPIEIVRARTCGDMDQARNILMQYATAIRFDLTYQGFERELADLPGEYAPPQGRLMLARLSGRTVGCVALRRVTDQVCEVRRLYVQPACRGRGLGRRLAEAAIREARTIGYHRVRLETLPSMKTAVHLLVLLGFHPIQAFGAHPLKSARYFGLKLRD